MADLPRLKLYGEDNPEIENRFQPRLPLRSWDALTDDEKIMLQEWGGGSLLKFDIAATFIELGDSTSHNLEFSHRADVHVSYGEETITEINLLEIRRRHPELVRVSAFTKPGEAKSGADWEWYIVGRKYTAKMRVQAKRLQRNDALKVKHTVKSSGTQQRKLLIGGANAANMKAMYCIYCTEPQRKFWTEYQAMPGYKSFQTGCLLAKASDVPLTTRRLDEIEEKCIPWHYLFVQSHLVSKELGYFEVDVRNSMSFIPVREQRKWHVPIAPVDERVISPSSSGWSTPTIEDLNGDTGRDFDWTGVEETTEGRPGRAGAGYRTRTGDCTVG